MGVRDFRAAGLRRAAGGRAGFVGGALALYAAAAVTATWPAIEHAGTKFLASRAPAFGEPAPGDHLQTSWNLWLFGHQLAHLRAFWLDPYSFQPELAPRPNFPGLVFGLPFWPLAAAFGLVVAWNVFVVLSYVGAGGAMCAWLRSLELPRGAALAGGLAFALAPYRVAQSTGHLLGPISMFVPLSLLGLELGRPWLAGAAVAAIPLSGQVHLALGAVPLFVAYALVRRRPWHALPGVVAAGVAAALVQRTVIRGSAHETGRTLQEVDKYSAHWSDFVSRNVNGETFVLLGWATPIVAVAGLLLLVRGRRYALAAFLALAALVPGLLALGTNLPTYEFARHVIPGLRVSRVPERMMPIACFALAALVGVAVARARPLLVPLAVALIAVDLHVGVYGAQVADEGNAAYAALRAAPPGRLLDLPVFLPDVHLNSTYLYYDTQAQRQRPTGYSTTIPRPADTAARILRPLTCGTWPAALMETYDVRYVAVHRGFYDEFQSKCAGPAVDALRRHGYRLLATGDEVEIFARAP
jgi:hypothetical protein